MAVPSPSHLQRWLLEPDEQEEAAKLSTNQLRKLETMNAELAEALAEFVFQAGGDSGALLNSIDFWQLRGRRSLILQLLQEHDDATGNGKPPESSEQTEDNQRSSQTF